MTSSEDVIDNEEFIFWNIIIGEGSAKEPSDAILVIVYVEGEAGFYEPTRQVEPTGFQEGSLSPQKTADRGVLAMTADMP